MSNLDSKLESKRVVSPATQEATPSTSGGGKEGVKVPISAAASRRRRAEVIGTVRKSRRGDAVRKRRAVVEADPSESSAAATSGEAAAVAAPDAASFNAAADAMRSVRFGQRVAGANTFRLLIDACIDGASGDVLPVASSVAARSALAMVIECLHPAAPFAANAVLQHSAVWALTNAASGEMASTIIDYDGVAPILAPT